MRIRGSVKQAEIVAERDAAPAKRHQRQLEAGLFHAGLRPHAHVADLAVIEPVVDPVACRQQRRRSARSQSIQSGSPASPRVDADVGAAGQPHGQQRRRLAVADPGVRPGAAADGRHRPLQRRRTGDEIDLVVAGPLGREPGEGLFDPLLRGRMRGVEAGPSPGSAPRTSVRAGRLALGVLHHPLGMLAEQLARQGHLRGGDPQPQFHARSATEAARRAISVRAETARWATQSPQMSPRCQPWSSWITSSPSGLKCLAAMAAWARTISSLIPMRIGYQLHQRALAPVRTGCGRQRRHGVPVSLQGVEAVLLDRKPHRVQGDRLAGGQDLSPSSRWRPATCPLRRPGTGRGRRASPLGPTRSRSPVRRAIPAGPGPARPRCRTAAPRRPISSSGAGRQGGEAPG